jgi:hypothetical protein
MVLFRGSFYDVISNLRGRNCLVGIAKRYVVYAAQESRFDSWQRQEFPLFSTASTPALWRNQPHIQCVAGSFHGE